MIERATTLLNGTKAVNDISAATATLTVGWTQMKNIEEKIKDLKKNVI